jgi:hypothetical protein
MNRILIRKIVKEEIENILMNEFYNSKTAIGGYKFTKFINDLDKIKDGRSKLTLEELIYNNFNIEESKYSNYDDLYLLLNNYIEDNIGLRDVSKELRNFGLLRGN